MLEFLLRLYLAFPTRKYPVALLMIRNIGLSFAIVPIWSYNRQWNKESCRDVNGKFKKLKSDLLVRKIFSQFTSIFDPLWSVCDDHNILEPFSSTMRVFDHFLVLQVLVTACSFPDFASSDCSKGCRKEEVCCAGLTCRPAGKCRWCIMHGHCPEGEKCVDSHCTAESCSNDRDCYNNTEQHLKCCQGRCTNNTCSSSTPTPATQSTTARTSCITWRDCSHGEQCERGSCEKTSNVMLTKAGFLSAAILTGSVFLLILCCCFVRESKYSRQRYIERQRRRSRSRSRRRRSTQQLRSRSSTTTIAVENRAFSIDDCNACEGGLHVPPPEYPTESATTDRVDFPGEPVPVTPPPYYTLSFDLPPTYEEALQNDENGNSETVVT